MASITPTQDGIQIALRTALLGILPDGVDVIAGVQNRVPEPDASRFVVMTPIRGKRLRTNIDSANDVRFTASIAAAIMTVTDVAFGTLLDGAVIFGTGIAANTRIVDQLTGPPGLDGTYQVSVAQTLSSRTLASGAKQLEQGAQVTVQLDFHSADNTAFDLAQMVATVLRDEAGVALFTEQDPNYGVVPLYADDPVYRPFLNENQQAEWRWMLEAQLQVNQVTSLPQQYADAVEVEVINVDAAYPP